MVGSKNPHVPKLTYLTEFTLDLIKEDLCGVNMYVMLLVGQLTTKMNMRLIAYHINQIYDARKTLFPNDTKYVAMIQFSMDLVRNAVNIVNHGQTPVIACDTHLAKTFSGHGQRHMGTILIYGDSKMTLLKCTGDLLNRSGWTSAISLASIAITWYSRRFSHSFTCQKDS